MVFIHFELLSVRVLTTFEAKAHLFLCTSLLVRQHGAVQQCKPSLMCGQCYLPLRHAALSSRYPADRPLPNSCHPPPSHCAHISGSRNTHLQLRAPSVVITLQMFEDGAVQSHHGYSTAGAAGLVPPTRTFLLNALNT